jgi:hypothetical protein
VIGKTQQVPAGLLHLSRERCLACGGRINVTKFLDMLRLVNRRGISAGFLSCLNSDLHFNFKTGCVRNVVRTRIAIVGSDCEPGLIMYSVCMGAGEKRESIFSCVP